MTPQILYHAHHKIAQVFSNILALYIKSTYLYREDKIILDLFMLSALKKMPL